MSTHGASAGDSMETGQRLPQAGRAVALLGFDAIAAAAALQTAFWLQFERTWPSAYVAALPVAVGWLVAIRVTSNAAFRLHAWSFRTASVADALRIGAAGLAGTIAFSFLCPSVLAVDLPRGVYAFEFFLATAAFAALRFTPRLWLDWMADRFDGQSRATRGVMVTDDAAESRARGLRKPQRRGNRSSSR